MNILIYGADGWIGSQVIKYLDSINIKYSKGCVRAEDIENLEKEIISLNPTHIISFIGRTHGTIDGVQYTTIDYLEQKGKLRENVRDNLYSPIVLAMISKKYNIHYTYLGTGCIFEYDSEHPFGLETNGFTEDSYPNFFGSSYSVVKGYTDKLMHLFDNVLNLRIRMPITCEDNPRNFITKITSYEKICSVPNSMTVLPDMIPIIIDLAKNNKTGTLNLVNPNLISHNEILEMYKEIVDPNFTWKNFSIEEQNKILASGRSNNHLDTTKLQELYPDILPIKESVRKCLHIIKNNRK
jgi:3,5-epimerase/4-reductase